MPQALSDLPFALGTTFFDGATPDAVSGSQYEGREYWVKCENVGSGQNVDPILSNSYKKVRCVRNVSGGALLPKRIGKMKTDGSAFEYLSQLMGYATTVGEVGFPIDEFLPAAGVSNNDLCFVVTEGLAKVTTAGAGDTNISIGSMVIPSTSGTVIDQDTTVAAGTATFNQIQGAIGRAVTAVNAISTDFYIKVARKD